MRRAVVLSGQGVQVEGRKNDLDDLVLVSTKRVEATLPPFFFFCSHQKCVGDQFDLRSVSLPGTEPPGLMLTLTSRRIEKSAGGLMPATGIRVLALLCF